MRRFLIVTLPLIAIALAAAGCDNSGGTTAPTVAAPVLTTETFTGTVKPQGSDSHTFTAAQTGQINVTLTAAGPPATIFMGLGVGTPSTTDATVCSLFSTATLSAQASTVAQISGTANAGTYCVTVFDIGNQSADITYTVTVAHP